MARSTILRELIAAGTFREARELLQTQLLRGEVIDPRREEWAPSADMIATAIAQAHGSVGETIPFWEDLLSFIVGTLEPAWGRAHKGHIYFRLAVAAARMGVFFRAQQELGQSYEEDRLTAIQEGRSEDSAREQSAYVALCILERLDDADFADHADKEAFVRSLFVSFDAVIRGERLDPAVIRAAIGRIAPTHDTRLAAVALYEELLGSRGRPFATAALTGSVVETLLLGDLVFRRRVATGTAGAVKGKDLLKVELGALMAEAEQQGIFPTDSIRVAFRLAHVFRNRLHTGNELGQQHRLVPRVAETVRGVAEAAILQWREAAFP